MELQKPPPYPIEWRAKRKDGKGKKVKVVAQTYFEARAVASIALRTSPDNLDVRPSKQKTKRAK